MVTPFQFNWKEDFESEAAQLKKIFKELVVEVHHIGSTSVPGLAAKPVLDILPVVTDIQLVDDFNREMEALGYEPKGENGLPGRRFFQKGGDDRTHHVHIFQNGHPDIARHLVFRDYLLAHPHRAADYGQLKLDLAERYPYDIDAYIQGKTELVMEIEREALEWGGARTV